MTSCGLISGVLLAPVTEVVLIRRVRSWFAAADRQPPGRCVLLPTRRTGGFARTSLQGLERGLGAALAFDVSQAGGQCIAITTDVTRRIASGPRLRHHGGLHETVVEAPIEEFWRAIRLDLLGTFLGCRFGIPAIIASGGASVVNMASNVAFISVAGLDCYAAAKGGIAAITRRRMSRK